MTARRRLSLFYTPSGKVGRLYWRELPGGGYVALDVIEEPSHPAGRYLGRVTVERRGVGPRRSEGIPPVIAELRAHTSGTLVHHLLPIARSNPAIGAALLRTGTVIYGR